MKKQNISNLSVYIVSSTQLGATEKDIGNVMQLMSGPGVKHYWDGEDRVGTAVQGYVTGLQAAAWDFWMIYAPGVLWEEDAAPEPGWWEHQLGALMKDYSELYLNAERFAGKAAELSR